MPALVPRTSVPLALLLLAGALAPPRTAAAPALAADPQRLAEWFPEDPLVYAESGSLGPLLAGWFEGDLHAKLMQAPAVRRFQRLPACGKLLGGLAYVELVTGRPPLQALAALCGEELGVAAYPGVPEPTALWVSRARSAAEAQEALEVIRNLGGVKGIPDAAPIEVEGLHGWRVGDHIHAAASGCWLLAATEADLLQRAAAHARPGLDAAPCFAAFSRVRRDGAAASFLVNTAALAAGNPGGRLVPERLEQPMASLLLGDLLEAAARSPWVAADLCATAERLDLEIHVPVPPAELPAAFQVFGHASEQALHRFAVPEGWITLSMRRNVADWWRGRSEFLTPAHEKAFREADSQIAVFFGGRSFADEVLSTLEEEVVLVGARQTFAGVASPPEVRYPAGALLVRARDPERLAPEAAAAFHSFLSILSLERARQGKSPMLLFTEEREGTTLYGGRYLDRGAASADPIRFNFSPVMARQGHWLVFSTTEALLHDLLPLLRETGPQGETLPREVCTALSIDGGTLGALLQDNRSSLLAKKLLASNRFREEVERELDLYLTLPETLDRLTLTSRAEETGFLVELDLGLHWPEGSSP